MADVKNVITLGIGSAPGSVKFFLTVGLDIPTPSTNLALPGTSLVYDLEVPGLVYDHLIHEFVYNHVTSALEYDA